MADKKHICLDCRVRKYRDNYAINPTGKLQIKTYINSESPIVNNDKKR